MSTQYALKFISGRYQGGEFPLKAEKQIVIGRSSELDMVLVEDMVSRKHARISVESGHITIEDLGSTNGTFVNGEKVKQARLKEGDRVLIGTSILKLVSTVGRAADMDAAAAKRQLEEAAAQVSLTKASSMTGKIEEIPLPDLLQLFYTSKKSGVLVVKSAHEGHVYLRQGRVYYAVIDGNHDLGPQKSFNRIITWEAGEFELRPAGASAQGFAVELDVPTEALLMEALRQFDEYRRIQRDLPPATEPLTLVMPMTALLRELSPEQLDVLQLVHNWGSLQSVLDRSIKDDVAMAQAILELIRRGYVCAA